MLRRHGGQIRGNAQVIAIERHAHAWTAQTAGQVFEAPLLVNAAGAWADEIAALAGVARIDLRPLRRTAALVDAPTVDGMARRPLTNDVDETFSSKPAAGRLPISQIRRQPCTERVCQ